MALLKRGRIVEDPWVGVDDDSPLPSGAPVVVSYDRWLRQQEALSSRNGPLGIILASDQSPELIGDETARFGLICLDFSKFTDGRAYSYARMIRAVGAVLRDQLLFMRRCGFDSFVIPSDARSEDWAIAFDELTVRYQPTVDRAPTVSQLRRDQGYIAPGPHGGATIAGSWSY
jgi:uncharacterized protein (DUF934 family)